LQVEFKDLVKYRQIASSDQHSLRRLLDETASRQGVKLNCAQTIASVPQPRELVLRGIGYAILPHIAFAEPIAFNALRFAPLRNPDLRLRSWLALTPRREPTRAASCIHAPIRNVIMDLVEDGRWPGGELGRLGVAAANRFGASTSRQHRRPKAATEAAVIARRKLSASCHLV
jgi:LysR family transcriptional regulator, nitrogen assimilation regulatory protein